MIRTAVFTISSTDVLRSPQTTLPEYAFIGRSNVGKSSLINRLTRQPKLAKTSQKPGKTLLINHFTVNAGAKDAWCLVDLPGYGFAQAGKTQRETLKKMIERYCLLRDALTSLFVLVDARLPLQAIDRDFMNWLGENEVPFAIVFTKADKLGKERLATNIDAYKQQLLEFWEELPPVFVTSAETGLGCDELTAYIEQINSEIQQPSANLG